MEKSISIVDIIETIWFCADDEDDISDMEWRISSAATSATPGISIAISHQYLLMD